MKGKKTIDLSAYIVVRCSPRLREELRVAGFEDRLPPSVLARQILKEAMERRNIKKGKKS